MICTAMVRKAGFNHRRDKNKPLDIEPGIKCNTERDEGAHTLGNQIYRTILKMSEDKAFEIFGVYCEVGDMPLLAAGVAVTAELHCIKGNTCSIKIRKQIIVILKRFPGVVDQDSNGTAVVLIDTASDREPSRIIDSVFPETHDQIIFSIDSSLLKLVLKGWRFKLSNEIGTFLIDK
jgi:hypothetical protein